MDDKKTRPNYIQDVTNKVIAMMEDKGLKPWEAGWDRGVTKAFNPYTREKGSQGREYRGSNALNLLIAQIDRNSTDSRWLTFNQAKNAGFSIRAQARASSVMYWQFPDAKNAQAEWNSGTDQPSGSGVFKLKRGQFAAFTTSGWMKESDTIEGAQHTHIAGSKNRNDDHYQWSPIDDVEKTARNGRPTPFYTPVFNGADIVGMPPMKERRVFDANDRAERLIQATGAVIEHRELARVGSAITMNRAYYDLKADQITVPPKGHFKGAGDYYSTVIHEIAHWTGHESRLNRGLDDAARGTSEYAREELRAEMASAMICSALGVDGDLENHAAYLDGYVKLLKEDRSAIFKAARDAEKIYDAVFDYDPALRAEIDSHLSDNAFSTADPDAKRQQVVNLKKIIKVELPSFAPVKNIVEPIAVVTPQPLPVVADKPAPTPVNNGEDDMEIDFGQLSLDGGGKTGVVGIASAEVSDEIGLDGFDLELSEGDTADQFSEIETFGHAP